MAGRSLKCVFLWSEGPTRSLQEAHGAHVRPEAAQLETRHEIIPRMGWMMDVGVRFVSVEQLLHQRGREGYALAREAIEHGDIVLIDGPLYRMSDYRSIEKEVSKTGIPCLDTAANVEAVANLSSYYPLLKKQRIPQPRTVLVPLTPEDLSQSDSKEFYKKVVGKRIELLLARGKMHPTRTKPAFYRTFFSSAVGGNVWMYRAESVVDVVNSSYEVIYDCSGRRDTGGLAVREFLELQSVYPAPMRDLYREYRVFVIGGVPVWYTYYYGLGHVDTKSEKFEEFKKSVALSAAKKRSLRNLAEKVAGVVPSHFFVIDIAYTRKKRPVVIDLGPGHAAGMAYKIGQVPVLYALLNYAAYIAASPKRLRAKPKIAPGKLLNKERVDNIVDALGVSRRPLECFCGYLI
ncbi:MAG: hypothetical protein DRP79_08250 [Planctomycetota bacterium]|nr:MAG: hypothetical protein DRP79_08250 [Planctomycetota bacterium]